MSVFVGVDIAAKSFDLVSREAGKSSRVHQFSQTPQGHAKAIEQLRVLQPVLIVMEATGIYYLDLAVALADAGLPVAVINPKSFRHFAALKLTGSRRMRSMRPCWPNMRNGWSPSCGHRRPRSAWRCAILAARSTG